MAEVIVISEVNRFASAPPDHDHRNQIQQRHREDEQRLEDRPDVGVFGAVKMRQDGQNGHQKSRKVAACVSEKSRCAREIVRQEPNQGAACKEGYDRDKILAP